MPNKYNTVTGEYDLPQKYKISLHRADLSERAPVSFLGAQGVGQERFDYGVRPEDIEYLEQIRAMRQPASTQLKNASIQALAEIVGGTIEGIGYLGEIPNVADIIDGTEQEFGNWLSDFGKNIKEQSREAFPIYQDYGEGFHPENWSWWMSHAPSIASTLSLMISSGAATGAVASLVKATGAFNKLSKAGRVTAKGVTQGIFSRHMESMMEASQTYDELYDKNLRNGLNPEDAKKNAAFGAASVYNRNWVMLATDIPQYILLGTGLKGMKALRAAGDDVAKGAVVAGKTIIPAKAKPTLNLFKTAISESAEEGYQFVVQKEADYLAQRALDPNIESEFSDRLREYMNDGDMWSAAWFGALGGVTMQAFSGLNRKLTQGRVLREDFKTWGAESSRMYKTMMTATETGNTNLVTAGMDAGFANMMNNASAHGNLGRFKEFVETIGKEDVTDKELGKYGIDRESAAIITKNKDELLSDINRYEEIYNDNVKRLENEELKSPTHAALLSRSQFLVEKFNSRIRESNSKLQDLKNNIVRFDELSSPGQEIVEKEAEILAAERELNMYKKYAEDAESESVKESYNLVIGNIEEVINTLKERVEELKKDRTPEEVKNDKTINIKSKTYDEYVSELENNLSLKSKLEDHQYIVDKLEKGEMPFNEEEVTDTHEDETEKDKDVPRVDDLVVYTNPETNFPVEAKVKKIENDSDYTIQPVSYSEEGGYTETNDKPFKVSVENLERLSDSTSHVEPTIDTVNPDEDLPSPFAKQEWDEKVKSLGREGKGLAHFGQSMAWWKETNPNLEFNKFFSNPNLSKEHKANAIVRFTPVLSKEELEKGSLEDNEWVDNVEIKIKVQIAGLEFKGNIWLHKTDYKNIHPQANEAEERQKCRDMRREILKLAKEDKTVTTKGIDNNSIGHPNNTGKVGQNIEKAWNQDSRELEVGIVNQDAILDFGSGRLDRKGPTFKGMILIKTHKTINGEPGLVRVNPKKLSKEHASILFDAITKLYKDGYNSEFKAEGVESLRAGDVVNILALMGERQTSLDHPGNALPEYLRDKQLFVDSEEGVLNFGYNSKTGKPHRQPVSNPNKDMKNRFVKWATEHKNYPAYISSKSLGIKGINEKWDKAFKLGDITYDGKGRYADVLIKNGLLTTDVEEFVPGTVMEGPVVEFNGEGIGGKATRKPPKPPKEQNKEIPKPIKEEDSKAPTPEVNPEEPIMPKSMKGDKKILRRYEEKEKYVKQDFKKELRKVRGMLGKRVSGDVREVDQIIKIASQGKKAWATYRHDLITIYNAAETGTLYHEAFHRVSLGYLTPEEREAIYDEARRKYGLRGLSAEEIDDELAERFRVFVLSKDTRTLPQRIGDFFKRILGHIRAFISGPNRLTSYEIDRLFNAIYYGQFKRSKVREDAYQIDEEILRRLYDHEFDQVDTIDQLRETVKGLTYILLTENNISLDDITEDAKKLDWGVLKEEMKSMANQFEARYNVLPEDHEEKGEVGRKLAYWRDLLGYNEKTDRYEGFNVIRSLITQFLSSMNIQVEEVDPDNLVDEGESEGNISIEQYEKTSYEVSVKENALGAVKLRVALLWDGEINPYTGMYSFVNYNNTWNALLGDLYEHNDIEDMIIKIRDLSNVRPGYSDLLKILDANPGGMFKQQFFATMDKHKHAFLDAVADFKEGKVDYEFHDADVRSASRQKVSEWWLDFQTSTAVNDGIITEEFKKEINKDFDSLNKIVRSQYDKPDFVPSDYYAAALSILNKAHIGIDAITIDTMLSDRGNSYNEAFADFVISDIGRVVNNVIGKNQTYEDSAVNKFGDVYARSHPEFITNMVLGPGSAQYYVYANNSVVTSLIRDIKLDPKEAETLLNKRGNIRSKFLKQLVENEEIRKRINVKTFAGVRVRNTADEGRDYLDMTPEEDYAVKLHATPKGLICFPTLADKKTYYFLDGFDLLEVTMTPTEDGTRVMLSEKVIDNFMSHVRDEYDRITKAREDRDRLEDKDMVGTYHTDGKAYDFVMFKGLKYDTYDETEARERINRNLNRLILQELDYAEEMGLIKKEENGKYKSISIGKTLLKDRTTQYGNEHAAIVSIFSEYVARTLDNNMELHKMFIGDPAFYKDELDISKRLGAIIASGEEMIGQSTEWGEDLTKTTYNVSTIRTQKLKSAYYDNLFNAFLSRMPKEETAAGKAKNVARVKKLLKPYTQLEQADGQAFITPELYRSIAIRMGEWSQRKEQAFNLLQSDRELSDIESREAMNVILNPLKTVHFGFEDHYDIALPVYDKMSMFPLFKQVFKDKQLGELLTTMYDQNIDMVKMDSAVKVGERGTFELWKDKGQTTLNDLSNLPWHPQKFKNLRRQQVTPVHLETRTGVGSQFFKIGMGDLNMDEKVYSFEGGKESGRKIANTINEGISQLSSFGKEEVDQELGYKNGKLDKGKVVSRMRREARKANMPISTIEAIKEVDGEFYLEMDSQPNRKWFWSRLISSITKKVINRKLPGGQFIQVSNLGYRNSDVKFDLENATEDKRIDWLRKVEDIPFIHVENGKVVPMGCVVGINLFKHIIPNYDTNTFSENVAFIKNNKLDVIGYRIPTQGQNSTVVMQVVGLLPEQAGDSIILPSEFTGLTGSDFDIDKLFMINKNYVKRGNKIEELDFIINNDEKAYDRMTYYKFRLYKNDFSDGFKEWYRKTNNDRIERIGESIDQDIDETKERLEIANEEDKLVLQDILDNLYIERDELREEKELYTYDLRDLTSKERIELKKRITDELIKLGGIQKYEDFRKLSEWEKNVPRAIENRVINAYMSILTSEEHLLKTAAPLGVVTDELKNLSKKVRDTIGEEELGMMEFLSPKYQSLTKYKYSSGQEGIGPFALHNSHHIITQLVEYRLNGGISPLQNYTKVKSKVEGAGEISVLDLATSKGVDGVDILDWLSALIDAHVDIAKDPYIIDLNVNRFTYDIISYLIRTGVGKQSFVFLSNPAIKLASQIFIRNQKSINRQNPMSWGRALQEAKERFANGLGVDLRDPEVRSKIEEFSDKVLDGKESIENDWFEERGTDNFRWKQLGILEKLRRIRLDSTVLTNDVQSSQIDTRAYGSSLIGLEAFFNRIAQSIEQSDKGRTFNYERIVPYDENDLISEKQAKEVFIADYYRNGLVHMVEVLSDISLDARPLFREAVKGMLLLTKNKNSTNESTINKYANELYSALLGRYFFTEQIGLDTPSIRGIFKDDEDSIFLRYNKLKSKYPELFEKNAFLNRFRKYRDSESIVKDYFILRDMEHNDPMEIDDIVYSWEQLLAYSDPEVNRFARHMFLYSFYTTGFNQRKYGFSRFIPPSFMKELKVGDKVFNLNNVVKWLHSALENDANYPMIIRAMDDVLSHAGKVQSVWDAIPESPNFASFSANKGKVYYKRNKNLIIGKNEDNDFIAVPYLMDRDGRLLKYQGWVEYLEEEPTFIYTEETRKGNVKGGRFVHEYGLDKPLFPNDNAPSSPSGLPSNIQNEVVERFGGVWHQVDAVGSVFNVKEIEEQEEITKPAPEEKEEVSKKDPLKISMYFEYDGNQREDITSGTTFEAIKKGERTSTLRKKEWYSESQWKELTNLQPGDEITAYSKKGFTGESIDLIVTNVTLFEVSEGRDVISDEEMDAISITEGWTKEYLESRKYDDLHEVGSVLYIQYKKADKEQLKIPFEEKPSIPDMDTIKKEAKDMRKYCKGE